MQGVHKRKRSTRLSYRGPGMQWNKDRERNALKHWSPSSLQCWSPTESFIHMLRNPIHSILQHGCHSFQSFRTLFENGLIGKHNNLPVSCSNEPLDFLCPETILDLQQNPPIEGKQKSPQRSPGRSEIQHTPIKSPTISANNLWLEEYHVHSYCIPRCTVSDESRQTFNTVQRFPRYY